jgi:ligand-binding SRPBCC domain-containing protein
MRTSDWNNDVTPEPTMKTYRLETRMTAPVPLREAFSFFESPYNLARITPPWLNLRITSDAVRMRKGAVITYTIRWLGIPLRWKTEITVYDPPREFVDEQAAGPYAFWRHRHTFEEAGENATVVSDCVEYSLPFSMLGRLAHRAVVKRQLEGIFAYRQAALRQLWDGNRSRDSGF